MPRDQGVVMAEPALPGTPSPLPPAQLGTHRSPCFQNRKFYAQGSTAACLPLPESLLGKHKMLEVLRSDSAQVTLQREYGMEVCAQGGLAAPTGSLQHILAQGHVSSPAPAAKFRWEATDTYLPSRDYSTVVEGAAATAFL